MRGSQRAAWVVAIVLVGAASVLALAPGAARAQDRSVSSEEAAALAREAVTSDAALRDLREVQRIDGRPVDLRAATAGLSGDGRRVRLTLLASELSRGGPGSGTDAREARRAAHDVVTGKDYRESSPPKPFKGVLRWLGDRLEPVGHFLQPVWRPIVKAWGAVLRFLDAIPGGRYLALAGVVALVAWLGVRLAARRSRAKLVRGPDGRLLVDPEADPVELERRAEEAEAAGDLATAVRLRYEAGLIRLVRAGRLELRPETTPGSAAAEVGGEDLHGLTVAFEEIVYGERRATADDVARSRAGWGAVLGAKARR